MKINRELCIVVGFLLLMVGMEIAMVKNVVLNESASHLVMQKVRPERYEIAQVLTGEEKPSAIPYVRMKFPQRVGHCMATAGFVLLLCCCIVMKDD